MRLLLLLPLAALGCSDETISGYADPGAIYELEEIAGVPFEAMATIVFPDQGRAEGRAPCNRWFAAQSAPYPWIDLGPIGATKRACPDLEAEVQFFKFLESASLAEVSGSVLILTDEDGQSAVFRAQPTE